jgi:hypothetical protein
MTATYRLQLHGDFGFAEVEVISEGHEWPGMPIIAVVDERSAFIGSREGNEVRGHWSTAPTLVAAARLALECIKKVECIEFEDLGMEAIWCIEVENFPAFIVTDDKGNDFFRDLAASGR